MLKSPTIGRWRLLAVTGLLAASPAAGQNLLVNGDLEAGIAEQIPGWDLTETVTGLSGAINSAQIVDFANNPPGTPGETGLWLRSFAANTEGPGAGTNTPINAILEQTVPATPGVSYTFSGSAAFEGNYSGGVSDLDPASPSGEIPSPTTNTFELAFLDAGGAVIGSPLTTDVAASVINGFGFFPVPAITQAAPAGAAEVRVRALAEDMVFNVDPEQTAFYDNFALTAGSSSANLLTNGDLNDEVLEIIPGFEFTEAPGAGFDSTLALAGFANNTPAGAFGIWLQAFAGGDATASQTVPGVAGADYTFSVASLFEDNFSGGDPTTDTTIELELAFLDGAASLLSSETLDLSTVQSNGAGFATQSLQGTSPAGTAEVRVSIIATDLENTEGAQSAFFDDLSLTVAGAAGLQGDYNDDGVVDAADYTLWRDVLEGLPGTLENETASPGVVDGADFTAWADNFGATGGSSVAVPEPAATTLAALASLLFASRRRVAG